MEREIERGKRDEREIERAKRETEREIERLRAGER